MSTAKKLGTRIKKLRQSKNLSQEDLAFESGLHRTYVSHVERGSRNITVLALCKLAKGLGLKPSDLLEGIS